MSSCVKLNKYLPIQAKTIPPSSSLSLKLSANATAAFHLCNTPTKQTADHVAVYYSDIETILQTSLHVTQDYRLQRSPVSRDVINYTYIDRNSIHYSWASQRQSYFPPFQHDEKILNNRPPLQTSAFQQSWLKLKRLKSELLSYSRCSGPTCFKLLVAVRLPGSVFLFCLCLQRQGWGF